MIIKNSRIYTMNERYGVIESGYILTDGKKIKNIGFMSEYDNHIENHNEIIIDAGGMNLFPGFIDAHSHLGMCEDSITMEGDDLNEQTDPQVPQLRAVDAINPMDRTFSETLAAGITCVATGPGSANPISGQFAVIKTYGKRIDDMVVKSPVSIKLALGENPKMLYGHKNQTPETRMATAAIIRENLKKAQKYCEQLEKAKETKDTEDEIDEPDYDIKCESLLPLIKGEIPAHIHAHRADDIFTAIRICKEFNLKYVIIHCTEGHLIAEELAAENIYAVIGPIVSDRSKPELRNLEIYNAKKLYDKKILFAITVDHPVIPLQYLAYSAAICVKGGLPKEEAYRALTLNPAKILGVDERLGSLEEGKDADFALFDGDPLEIMTETKLVAVDGKVCINKL